MTSVILLSQGFQTEYEVGFANGLSRNGLSVLLVGSDNTLRHRLEHGITLLNLRGSQDPARSRATKFFNVVVSIGRTLAMLWRRRGQPVHVIGTFTTRNLWATLVEAWLIRIVSGPYALTVHNILPHDDTRASTVRLCHAIYRAAAIWMVHTHRMREELQILLGADPRRIVVVEHGIDRLYTPSVATRSSFRAKHGIGEASEVLLFFGTVAPYKGLDVLIEAFHELDAALDVTLLVAGRCTNPGLRSALREAITANRNSAKIHWLDGYVPEEDVVPLFQAADLLVLPYRHIDQSGVVFMALATGLPVLATDVGSLREYVEACGGMVVEPGNSRALVAGVTAMMNRCFEHRRVSESAHRFLWSETVKPMLSVYVRGCGGAA